MSAGAPTEPLTAEVWYRQVLAFPLRPWLWPLVAAAAAIAGLVSLALLQLAPILAGLLALVTMVTLWILALRVASKILLATADGAGLEREYRDFDLGEFQALRQIGLWCFMALILAGLNESLGTLAVVIGLITLALLMPAMTGLVASTNSLGALSDAGQWRAWRRQSNPTDGRRLSGLFVVLGLTYLGLDALTGAVLLAFLSNALMMAAWIYSLWAFFYAIGRQLRAIRLASCDNSAVPKTKESIERLTSRLAKQGGSLEDYRRLIRALEQNGDTAGLAEHGPGYISALLLSHDRAPEAVERAAGLVELDPDFVLGVPSAQLELIEAARLHGYPDLVVQLADAYLTIWPAAPGGREARLIACEAKAQGPDSRCQDWFKTLVRERLSSEEQDRMRAIATAYVRPPPDRGT